MYRSANAGHVGSALSCAELMSVAFCSWMAAEDEFVLSKGHAAAVLYSCLAEVGKIAPAECETFYKDGTLLSAHPPAGKLPGVAFATGSLGHGLSLAAGLALGNRLHGKAARVFCLCSDGELNEGSTWEALLFAAHHRLTNLVCLVDRNQIQGFGRTENVMRLEPLAPKLAAFGWNVQEVDGHSLPELLRLRATLNGPARPAAPQIILANTQKGRGMGKLENTVDCHYLPLTEEVYAELLKGIEAEAGEFQRA